MLLSCFFGGDLTLLVCGLKEGFVEVQNKGSQLEKPRNSKSEFCLQEARAQSHKLQWTGERKGSGNGKRQWHFSVSGFARNLCVRLCTFLFACWCSYERKCFLGVSMARPVIAKVMVGVEVVSHGGTGKGNAHHQNLQ